jgi:hypothetical protein
MKHACRLGFELQQGNRVACIALRHDVARTTLTSPTLCRHTQFHLNIVKPQACFGMACNFSVGDSATDANDHGGALIGKDCCLYYKCE